LDENELTTYVEGNEGLVYEVVHRLDSKRKHTDEYYSVATIGFQKALLTYDPDQDTKFSTYAFTCMRNQVLLHIKKEKKWNVNKHTSLDEKVAGFDTENGETGIRVASYFSKEEKLVSSEDTPEEALIKLENLTWLHKSIKDLDFPPKHQEILSYYFEDKYTQAEIGVKMKKSQAYVSKVMLRCIGKLRELTQPPKPVKPVRNWRTALTAR
jgi:RNA polymerase sporulation-specific sigma factor